MVLLPPCPAPGTSSAPRPSRDRARSGSARVGVPRRFGSPRSPSASRRSRRFASGRDSHESAPPPKATDARSRPWPSAFLSLYPWSDSLDDPRSQRKPTLCEARRRRRARGLRPRLPRRADDDVHDGHERGRLGDGRSARRHRARRRRFRRRLDVDLLHVLLRDHQRGPDLRLPGRRRRRVGSVWILGVAGTLGRGAGHAARRRCDRPAPRSDHHPARPLGNHAGSRDGLHRRASSRRGGRRAEHADRLVLPGDRRHTHTALRDPLRQRRQRRARLRLDLR